MLLLLLILGIPLSIWLHRPWRLQLVSRPLMGYLARAMPPLSATEQEAIDAGSVWWEGQLFGGQPDWRQLMDLPKPSLSEEEQAFLTHQVDELLSRLAALPGNPNQVDLPDEIWRYLAQEGFFALIIPKAYGGREFSHYANSQIVARIAAANLSAAVTVMVPNSLGPAELLLHYGTQAQQDYWLPRLARGEEIPCFALTGPEAGSDAGAIPDLGVVTRGQWQGNEVIGIRLNWNKRYITLAPRASVIGLAFKLNDPDHLLGEQEEYGISCALIPANLPGVQIGDRHLPMGQRFLNGPIRGEDVFIPLESLIGGIEWAGKGWRMLVECLSAGRGISLPALGTACGQLACRTSSAYAFVRQQFGQPIGRFEGVQESLARIAGLSYQMDAARQLTTTALDLGARPGVATAIAKYHITESARRCLLDAMDIHAGRAIMLGRSNYLAYHYMGIPIAITVEGANILTRSLMIYGQGAVRCHPFLRQEMACLQQAEGLAEFDGLLRQHVSRFARHLLLTLVSGLTLGRLDSAPSKGYPAGYYRQLTRMSRALALTSDLVMLLLGGRLKRRELLTARLGDWLSQLYLASATLKRFADEGSAEQDRLLLDYAMQHSLQQIGLAVVGVCANLPWPWLGWLLKRWIFPFGNGYAGPRDRLIAQLAQALLIPDGLRQRLLTLHHCPQQEQDPVGRVELAFMQLYAVAPLHERLQQAQKQGQLPTKVPMAKLIEPALALGLLSAAEAAALQEAERLRYLALQVDSFAASDLERGAWPGG
ncbi:acyl-CoA dehydrogenase [Pseudaeromonas paramecii]|uniref:acyl-CoA dehydrogenase n=1 Tax=Pseudaeromonas paramecii TaxID=2138166 RepID=UPI003CD07036